MNNKPSEEAYRELFARYGLAYYQSECLYIQLCANFSIAEIQSRYDTTRPQVEERFAHALTLTLGELSTELRDLMPAEIMDNMKSVLEARNFLAHRFWIERSTLVENTQGLDSLLAELDRFANLFERTDTMSTSWFNDRIRQIGGVDSKLQESFSRIASGSRLDPLPSRREIQNYDRKLKGVIKITRAWNVTSNTKNALVLEEEDGALWQFCDLGLGWSSFKEIGTDWVINSDIQPYLPAVVRPRPIAHGAWDFEIALERHAIIVVKPGKRKGTFLLTIQAGSNA